ncbi:phosphomannomutase/phosphoglucomutase [Arthrobacter deserti]|uniref:Phosphomannomutase/phosphoglucomutase n=1 Tax=Arthrobacter deserti TaxID=1742687 RepID=A0ABX1JKJ3_9MICC|nr:phosphomannomutase/phosphoglucomutase [Arthrobacter deserti]
MTSPNLTDSFQTAFKAYVVRGIVGETITAATAEAPGAAFVDFLGLAGVEVLVGGDMRPSSPEFEAAFAAGAAARGAHPVMLGRISTDQLYYACGTRNAAGATSTASHNPAQYNGIKLARPGGEPVSADTGLYAVRDAAAAYLADGIPDPAEAGIVPGTVRHEDVLAGYAAHLRSLVDLSGIRPLKVVVDAGNGMAGLTTPAVLGDALLEALPLGIVPLYFELDGTIPNHPANPLEPENLVDLQAAVRRHGADLGLAFDGDADRCFVVDETGVPVSPSAITALVAVREIARAKAAGEQAPAVIHNVITSRAVPELVAAAGGRPVATRVGHSFIKAVMAEQGAVFGGEHSAHYYFRDFFNADTGMPAAMHVLAALGGQKAPLSELAAGYEPYFASGEINSVVADQAAATARAVAAFAGPAVTVQTVDGTTVAAGDGSWWFNLRPSNTEPYLRYNGEARERELMETVRDRVLALVRQDA